MPLGEDVTNRELEKFLFPDRKVSKNVIYAEPDYPYIHKELSKKGVTLTLLWNEYCERCRSNGEIPYMSTQFCDKYRRWAKVTKATMRINHKPGETMQVDWAGGTIRKKETQLSMRTSSRYHFCSYNSEYRIVT